MTYLLQTAPALRTMLIVMASGAEFRTQLDVTAPERTIVIERNSSSGVSAFADLEGNPTDNAALSAALDAKADATDLDGITFAIVGTFLHVTKAGATKRIRLLDLS